MHPSEVLDWISVAFISCAMIMSIWVTVRTSSLKELNTVQPINRDSLEYSDADVKHVVAKKLVGDLENTEQLAVKSIGKLNANMDCAQHNITNVVHLQTKKIDGTLVTPHQTEISQLGTMQEDLNMGSNDIKEAGTVYAQTFEGQLLTLEQPHITSIGSMTSELDLGGHNILNASNVTCELFDGTLSETTQSLITHTGTLEQDIQFSSTIRLVNTGLVFADNYSRLILRVPKANASHFNISFEQVLTEGNILKYIRVYNESNTTRITSLVEGTYAAVVHQATWTTTSKTFIGWLGGNNTAFSFVGIPNAGLGNKETPPQNQLSSMYSVTEVPAGYPGYIPISMLVTPLGKNEYLELIAATEAEEPINIPTDSTWEIQILRLH